MTFISNRHATIIIVSGQLYSIFSYLLVEDASLMLQFVCVYMLEVLINAANVIDSAIDVKLRVRACVCVCACVAVRREEIALALLPVAVRPIAVVLLVHAREGRTTEFLGAPAFDFITYIIK